MRISPNNASPPEPPLIDEIAARDENFRDLETTSPRLIIRLSLGEVSLRARTDALPNMSNSAKSLGDEIDAAWITPWSCRLGLRANDGEDAVRARLRNVLTFSAAPNAAGDASAPTEKSCT
jgi:hypothetical protein